MRKFVGIALLLALTAAAQGQDGDKGKARFRFGIEQDTKKYPQSNAKEALGSVLRAAGEKQYDYMLAHLADPVFVNKRVAQIGASLGQVKNLESLAFSKLVELTAENFQEDPTKLKELQRFLKDGDWDEGDGEVVVKLKGVQARKVFMKKVEDRWVLLDREK